MSWLSVTHLSKQFPSGAKALQDVTFAMNRGEFFTIVGPTNAGKSTLLKTIAGLVRLDAGRIEIDDTDITATEPRDRKLSLLFQNIALFPALTGFENIAFPLRAAHMPEVDIAKRVQSLAEMLRVSHVLDRLPQTFSGGEQQRVAIGRALAAPCRALLLDEPLTNLDARIRIALRVQFKTLHRDTAQTILYVTHDQIEAFSLSDRIAVLDRGRIQQIGTPDEIYLRPINRFVASFMGMPPMNILNAELREERDQLKAFGEGFSLNLRNRNLALNSCDIGLGLRPESIQVGTAASAATPFASEVRWVERLGAKNILELSIGHQMLKAVVAADHPVTQEGPAFIGFEPDSGHVLDLSSDRFIYASQ